MKELLIYNSIYSWMAASFIQDMEAAKNSGVTARVCSNGGDVQVTFGMIAKWKEYTGTKQVKVDGYARSMMAFFLCYADNNECLDVSEILFHRAGYGDWIEQNANLMSDSMWEDLNRINAFLRAALEAKVDAKKWKQVTGVTIDEMFDTAKRIDVVLNAQQAKELGLISKINTITPEIKAVMGSEYQRIAAEFPAIRAAENPTPTPPKEQIKNPHKMEIKTLADLRAQYPQLVAEAQTEAAKDAVTAERDRIKGWQAWAKVDPERVAKAIAEGEELTTGVISELSVKAVSNTKLANIKADNAPKLETDENDLGKDDKEVAKAAFESALDKKLGLNKPAVK